MEAAGNNEEEIGNLEMGHILNNQLYNSDGIWILSCHA